MFAKIIGVVGVQCQGETSLSHFLTAMRDMHGHAIYKMCTALYINIEYIASQCIMYIKIESLHIVITKIDHS